MIPYVRAKELTDYMISHHIHDPEVQHKYRLSITERGEIEIAVRDENGRYLFSKFRVFGVPGMKYRYQKGSTMALYNRHLVGTNTKKIYLVEGEFDAIALNERLNDPTVAVVSSTGGCSSFSNSWIPVFQDKQVIIIYDNDNPGVEGAVKVFDKLNGVAESITIAFVPGQYKDICEYLQHEPGPELYIKEVFTLTKDQSHRNKKSRFQRKLVNDMFFAIDNCEITHGGNINKNLYDGLRNLGKMYYDGTKRLSKVVSYNDDIESIKKVPITQFVSFRGGVAQCIFHSDRNPSMYYNDFGTAFPNTVKCYACGKFADVIDVVMELNHCSFKEALELLKN